MKHGIIAEMANLRQLDADLNDTALIKLARGEGALALQTTL